MAENKSDPAVRPSGSDEDAGRRDVEDYLASQAWETRLAEARARREKVLATRQAAGGEQAARPSLRPLPIPGGDAQRKTMLAPPRQTVDPGAPDIPAETETQPRPPLRRRAVVAATLCGGAAIAILGWFVLPASDPDVPATSTASADDPQAARTTGGSEDVPVAPAGARDAADTAMSPPDEPAPAGPGDSAKRAAPNVLDRADGLAPVALPSADPSLPRSEADLATSYPTDGLPGEPDPSRDAGRFAPFSTAPRAPPGPVPEGSRRSSRAAPDLGFGPDTPSAVPVAGSAAGTARVAFGSSAGNGVPALASLPDRQPGPRGDVARALLGRVPARPGAALALEGPVASDGPDDAFRAPLDRPVPQDGTLPERTAAPGGAAAPSALASVGIADTASYELQIHAASNRSADALHDRLTGAGFTTIEVSVAPFQWQETRIFYFHDEDARVARGIADLLGGTAMSAAGIAPSPPAGRIDVHLGG